MSSSHKGFHAKQLMSREISSLKLRKMQCKRQESRLSSEKRLGKNNVACFKSVGANVFEVNPGTKCRTHAEHCRNLLTDPKLIDSMQNFDRVCFETLSAPALCLRTAHHRSTCLGADKMLRYLFLDLDGLGMSWVCFGFWAYASCICR
jgi:hypothetical protein